MDSPRGELFTVFFKIDHDFVDGLLGIVSLYRVDQIGDDSMIPRCQTFTELEFIAVLHFSLVRHFIRHLGV